MDSAPVVAPNGDWSIGNYDGGVSFGGPDDWDARGFGLLFDHTGAFKAKNEEFFWEVTLSVWTRPDGSFSYLQDRQFYSDVFNGDETALSVASYSPNFELERRGSPPLSFEPVAIDFLDAHIPFGSAGDHYGVNGDGHMYKFDDSGTIVDSVELTNADGSARSMETLSGYFARDAVGRIYASYAGNVYVIASSGGPDHPPTQSLASSAKLRAGRAAKVRSLEQLAYPEPLID